MFPPTDQARIQWNEPWLFRIRTRGLWGWALPVGVLVAFAGLFAFLLAWENASAGGTKFSTARLIVLPIVIGIVFAALLELPSLRRVASISDRGVACVGAMSLFVSPVLHLFTARQWGRPEIKDVLLLRPGEGENRLGHGVLIIVPKYASRGLIGVPPEVTLEQLATALHAAGIPVTLTNWRPPVGAGEVEAASHEANPGLGS
jgi:hypothetical protein